MGDARTTVPVATVFVAIAAGCFGSIPVLVSLATGDGTPLVSVLAWRYALGGLLLGALVWRATARTARGPAMRLFAAGGIGQVAVAFTSLSALRWLPAATLGFLFYTYPAWVALLAAVRGTERLTTRRVLALALALSGIGVMVGAPSAASLPLPGLLLALGSAVLYAIYIPLVDHLRSGVGAEPAALFITLGAAACLVILAVMQSLITREPLDAQLTATMPGITWWSILAMATMSTALAFVIFLRGLATLGPVRTAIVSTMEPFWTTVLGALFLDQRVGVPTLAGGALIASAVLLLQGVGNRE